MNNYVISLSTQDTRRQHILKEFGKHAIAFEFFDAVTPTDIHQVATQLNITHILDSPLSDIEKSCFLSHVCLWQKIIDDDLDFIAVFEDDVYLGENAHWYFSDTKWLIEHNIQFIKTETCLHNKQVICTHQKVFDDRELLILKEYHLGTGSYIISQNTAKDLLDYIKQLPADDILAIDNLMFDGYLKLNRTPIYQLNPAISIQEIILYPNNTQMPSMIESSRKQRKKNKPKRTIMQKLKGELHNLYKKTLGRLSRKKITFR